MIATCRGRHQSELKDAYRFRLRQAEILVRREDRLCRVILFSKLLREFWTEHYYVHRTWRSVPDAISCNCTWHFRGEWKVRRCHRSSSFPVVEGRRGTNRIEQVPRPHVSRVAHVVVKFELTSPYFSDLRSSLSSCSPASFPQCSYRRQNKNPSRNFRMKARTNSFKVCFSKSSCFRCSSDGRLTLLRIAVPPTEMTSPYMGDFQQMPIKLHPIESHLSASYPLRPPTAYSNQSRGGHKVSSSTHLTSISDISISSR